MKLKNLLDAIAKLQTTHPTLTEDDVKFEWTDDAGEKLELKLASLRVEGECPTPLERGKLEIVDIDWTHELIFELVTE